MQRGRKSAYRRYLIAVLIVGLLMTIGVGAGNYVLNPLSYDRAYISDVARILDSGRGFANYDPNINWRALRREQIRQMTSTPDIVILGGSRWWEAHADQFPGRTLFNSWVSNDEAEDALALTYLLDQAGRLPKTMILSLRFISFQPPPQRDTPEWQEWAPEYSAMARKLGLSPHPLPQNVPVKQWSGLLYLPGLYDRTVQVSQVPETPGATDRTQLDKLDVIAPDGSVHWSRAHEAKYTKANTDAAVRRELRSIGQTAPAIDLSLVDMLGKAIGYLRDKGVNVLLLQTPYHPDFYRAVQARPFGQLLRRLEHIGDDLASRYGVRSVGGYDPTNVGCTANEFIDQIHPRPGCLTKVLRLIPPSALGS